MTVSQFDLDLDYGMAGENHLYRLLGPGASIEVKRDSLAHLTGNVFVEIQSRGKLSGLSTTTADWWAFCLDDSLGRIGRILLVPTGQLKTAIAVRSDRKTVAGGDKGSSRGYLIPITELVRP